MKQIKLSKESASNSLKILLLLLCSILVAGGTAGAGDLNDGISSYRDESIRADDQIGDPEVNYSFIEMRAKARISSVSVDGVVTPGVDSQISGVVSSSYGSMGNMNSVVLMPGASVSGDIVIIDESNADKYLTVIGDQSYSSGLGTDLEVDEAIVSDSLDDFDVTIP